MKKLLQNRNDKLIKRKDHNYIEKVKEININLHNEILKELYK